ncbi:enediyne biosynthesis protein [Amycolatopsis coloradensis]|uniref:Enediyne biosynthesis protein n=1 Tax=Amycolatopsis coloradensis TaxID=76021 RepID=A0A1R0KTT0_9PSEU|nr:DUF1702 family protein [Amycolatopsis coloradensis]OLZ51432.1 enediyne biosynthesis protein [Amycolatopsis coloradensis]
MPTTSGSLRRLVLTPALSEVSFATRGFDVTDSDAVRRLEAIPQAVVCGFEWGIDTRSLWELERKLELIEPEMRGFAYEGATMAFTVLDAMGGGHRTRDLLRGPGAPHLLLAYIGIGFAMAKLPRMLWKKVLPSLDDSLFHPAMSWLAVDGYGFDLAYFDKKRWVDRQEVPKPYPWQGTPDYFTRAVDQGIGRALWFMHGGAPEAVTAAVTRFPDPRHADLWSGVGLAATFAGGCAESGLIALRKASGGHAASVAVGSVFAVSARTLAGYSPPHTEVASRALTGRGPGELLEVAGATAVTTGENGVPAYELWRRGIRDKFAEPATPREKLSRSEK